MNANQNQPASADIDQTPESLDHCIVFGITANLAFALGTFLIGFFTHNPNWKGAVHVFHNGISDEDQQVLHRICGHLTFQQLTTQDILSRLNAPPEQSQAIENTITRYSAMYFAKFEMFNLLNKYKKIIWFDVDMLVLSALDQLWNFDEIAWRPALRVAANRHADLRAQYQDILEAHPVARPNAGLICISNRLWHQHHIETHILYRIFSDLIARKSIVTGDELSLMIMASQHRLHLKTLHKVFNCPSGSALVGRAKIIHSIGGSKFWNDGAVSAAFPSWQMHYKTWLEKGGSSYNGPVDESYIPLSAHAIITKSRQLRKAGK